MLARRAFGAGAAAAPLILSVSAPAAMAQAAGGTGPVTPHALEDFYGPTETYDAALSPDGSRIAVLRTRAEKTPTAPDKDGAKGSGASQLVDELMIGGGGTPEGHSRIAYVDIVDAAQPDKVQRVLRIGAYKVDQVEWGSENRLLVWVRRASLSFLALGGSSGGIVLAPTRRILSVSADGSASVVLMSDPAMQRGVFDLGAIVDMLPDQPDHVLMQAADPRANVMALWRVNILDGSATRVEVGRWNTVAWITDRGQAVLRYDTNTKLTVQRVYARAPGSSDWKFVRRTRTDQQPEFLHVGPSGKPGVILAAARSGEEDTTSIRELDLRTLAFGPPLHRRDGQDVAGFMVDERGRFLGAKFLGDRVSYDFADPAFASHFKGVNRYLGDERNVSFYDVDAAQNRYLAYVSGPRDPGQQLFYDKAARRVVSLGALRPNLIEQRLGKAVALTVRTRDGADIPAYLTAPPDGRRGPLLVWPHGGPEVRDYLDYSRTVQIFAAQGWWVLQPNFRGSGGFGQAFARAGHRRWIDRMQEDVEDAVAHVVALDKVDAGRIAIGGSSYGGYAALMGVVRNQVPYRCAISICGPSDMPVILRAEKKEDDENFDYWTARIGDPSTDKLLLEQASPARRAAEIRVPVLLIHGLDDKVVGPEQSKIMAKALKAAGKPHELIEVEGFGHANWDDDKDKELMTRMIGFLKQAFA